MQQLQFQKKWDKAISAQDRNYIEKVFNETKHVGSSEICFSPVREAINHQDALLVTVLIHNYTNQPLVFKNRKLVYLVGDKFFAERIFSIATLIVPGRVSMPWTFIFPKGSYPSETNYKNGQIVAG